MTQVVREAREKSDGHDEIEEQEADWVIHVHYVSW
jgi:hypothetical protein